MKTRLQEGVVLAIARLGLGLGIEGRGASPPS